MHPRSFVMREWDLLTKLKRFVPKGTGYASNCLKWRRRRTSIAFFRVNKLNVQNAPSPARTIPQQKRKSDRQAAQQQQQHQAGNSLGGGGGRREEEACDNGIMRRTVTELTVDAC